MSATGNPIAGLGSDAFLAAIGALLPPGAALAGPVLQQVLGALADQQAAMHAAAAAWSEVESDPARTALMLPDWEAEYGLPDPCMPLDADEADRRVILLARIAQQGGQSIALMRATAQALGYAVAIAEYRPFRVGLSRVGDPLIGAEGRFEYQVDVAGPRPAAGPSGTPVLECVLTRMAPAQTALRFAYGA